MHWKNLSDVEAARIILDHRERAAALPVRRAQDRMLDLARGYAIQDMLDDLLRARGARQIGYKIGGTNAAARAHLRIEEPFMGRLYDAVSAASPTELPALPGFFRLHEPEIAIEIARDLPPAEGPFDAAAIETATAAVLPGIEIVGTRLEPWERAGAPLIAADNAAHGFWVHGAPVRDWSGIDLMDGPVALVVDGEVRARGCGRNVDGGPFGAVAWLANELAARGRGLRAGDFVTTGTLVPPVPVAPGQHVVADFGPLGTVELRIGG